MEDQTLARPRIGVPAGSSSEPRILHPWRRHTCWRAGRGEQRPDRQGASSYLCCGHLEGPCWVRESSQLLPQFSGPLPGSFLSIQAPEFLVLEVGQPHTQSCPFRPTRNRLDSKDTSCSQRRARDTVPGRPHDSLEDDQPMA